MNLVADGNKRSSEILATGSNFEAHAETKTMLKTDY